jgi:formate dehydrogenase major subunit
MPRRRVSLGSNRQGLPGLDARLTYPLVRHHGHLVRASWEEALECAAEGLRRIRERYGGQGFGLFSCSKSTNELNYLAGKFARQVMGSNNVDSCNRT